jgi:membrane protein implicated in regulation of membrane protease activity
VDQKFRSAGWRATGILLIITGAVMLPLGFGLAFSWPSQLSLTAIFFLPFSVFMIWQGVKNLRSASNEIKEADKKIVETKRILAAEERGSALQKTATGEKDLIVLAHWKYTGSEWQSFWIEEKTERKLSMWIEIILIAILGAVLLYLFRSSSWDIAFLFSIPVALLIGILRFRLNLSSIKQSSPGTAEAIITSDAVVVNGRYSRLTGENLWIENAAIKEQGGIAVVEITYAWDTRRGRMTEEIRLPIPFGKMEEAKEVINKLKPGLQ